MWQLVCDEVAHAGWRSATDVVGIKVQDQKGAGRNEQHVHVLLQGLTLEDAQQRLALPAFAAAACDVLRSCADSVSALHALPFQEVGPTHCRPYSAAHPALVACAHFLQVAALTNTFCERA